MSPNRFSVTRTSKPDGQLRERHRRGVDEPVLQLHVREVGVDLVGHLAPQPARREDVGLVDLGHLAPARRGPARTPGSRSAGSRPPCTTACRSRPAPRRSGAARWACRSRGPTVSSRTIRQSTPSSSSGLSGDAAMSWRWTVIGRRLANSPRPPAEREQCLLRADRGVRVVPLRAADGAEQHGVGLAARLHVLGPAGDAVRVDPRPADDELGPVEARTRTAAPPPRGPRRRRRSPRARPRRPGSARPGSWSSRKILGGPAAHERDRDPVDLRAVELVGRDEVGLE